VHESVRSAFIEKFVTLTKQLTCGDPLDDKTDIGPMISEQEAERVEKWILEAVADGAKVECGGTRNGALFKPTLLSNVNEHMKVSCEELFAPVVCLTAYENLDECIRLINLSKYGLQAGIFTSSLETAFYAAKNIHVGGVMINDASQFRADSMPYGGVKASGWGKEGPKYAIQEMTDERIIVLNLMAGKN